MKDSFPSHQTVKLARGKHSSPREGVCAMELASMLSGERFSDRPYCVSPAIGGFLRAYNDFIDDRLRQDLYRLASAVVGTRGTAEIERMRVRRVIEWGQTLRGSGPWSRLATYTHGFRARGDDLNPDEAAAFAVRSIGRKRGRAHAEVLALVDELIACGPPGHADSPKTLKQSAFVAAQLERSA
ncbi:MAG: hypothetical protein ACTHQQ_15685 [Solirubrobacteraceae bacterium]